MCEDYYRRGAGIFGAFMLGAMVGAVLGLLFAPRSGKESRDYLSDKAQEYWGEGKDMYESGRARVVDMYESGKDYAGQAAEQVQAKIDAARTKLRKEGEGAAEAKSEAPVAPEA